MCLTDTLRAFWEALKPKEGGVGNTISCENISVECTCCTTKEKHANIEIVSLSQFTIQ